MMIIALIGESHREYPVIARALARSNLTSCYRDCFVGKISLLAMTENLSPVITAIVFRKELCQRFHDLTRACSHHFLPVGLLP